MPRGGRDNLYDLEPDCHVAPSGLLAMTFRALLPRHIIGYFTAPVMPSANCFCSTKNTMIVGSEQNSTPSISMP